MVDLAGPMPEIDALEELALDGKKAFSRVRNTMLKTGDMFLFGRPSSELLHIMMKMYHENIVKNMFFMDKDKYMSQSIRATLREPQMENIGFMCAAIDMGADQPADQRFFMTISEAPKMDDHVEDPNFDKKEKLALQLLRSCNITVNTVEAEFREPDIQVGWRSGSGNILDPKIFKKRIPTKGVPGDFIVGRDMLIAPPAAGTKGMNYDDALWKAPYTINFVNSYQYLHKRLEEGKSFVPFKKYDDDKDFIECNNGSTCCEAKLFSFVTNDLKKTFNDIKGFAVFWVGVSLPPAHHIQNYCYSPWKEGEDMNLRGLKDACMEILAPEIKGAYAPEQLDRVMFKVAQAIAMACPGCMSNYQAYRSGKLNSWNPGGCYRHFDIRTTRKNKIRATREEVMARQAEEKRLKREARTRKLKEGGPEAVVEEAVGEEAAAPQPSQRARARSMNSGLSYMASLRPKSTTSRRTMSATRAMNRLAGVASQSPAPGGGSRRRRRKN